MKKVPWEVEHKLESLEAWVHELNHEARFQFLKAGLHVELLMVFSDTGPTTMLPIYSITHEQAMKRLKNLIHEQHAYAVAHIVSCGANLREDRSEKIVLRVPDAEQKNDGDFELLVVHACSRDHSNITYFNPVARSEDEVFLLDPIRLDVAFHGRFEIEF
jgi:hypothetical protein